MLHVICGSPCSGKSTYIENNASKNALIIDADKIAYAFGGSKHQATGEPLKVALDARQMAIEHALKSDIETWLIDTLPTKERLERYEKANAEIVLMDTTFDVCMERAKERPFGTKEAIEQWHNNADILRQDTHIRRKEMETVKQEETAKVFTQEEVNNIISERIGRERAKYEGFDELKAKAEQFDALEEAQKSELDKATERAEKAEKELTAIKEAEKIRITREEVAKETGIPAHLLNGNTKEECEAQAAAIADYAKPTAYPTVKDAGELNNVTKPSTRQQFAEWTNNIF